MLYINGELLNVANKKEDYQLAKHVTHFHETIKRLKDEFGDSVKLKSSRGIRTDSSGKARVIPSRSISLEADYFDEAEGQQESWTYSTKLLSFKDGKFITSFERVLKIQRGELYISLKKDPDLAYYLLEKSNAVGDGRKYIIDNPRRKAKKTAHDRSRDSKLLYVIYNELDKTKLTMLAKSYGLSNVDNMDVEEIKNFLYDTVTANEKLVLTGNDSQARGIDAFMRDSDLNLRTQIGALVQDSQDKGVLVYNVVERRWEIDWKDGRANLVLQDIPREQSHRPKDMLVDFLHSDVKALEQLKKAMGVAGLVSIGVELDIILKEKNPQKLKKIAREYCSFKVENNATVADLKYKIIAELFSEETAKLELEEK